MYHSSFVIFNSTYTYCNAPIFTQCTTINDYRIKYHYFSTIISNYNPDAAVVISTHLIADVERILDDVVFISRGQLVLHQSVDQIRQERGCSVDDLFREVFRYAE